MTKTREKLPFFPTWSSHSGTSPNLGLDWWHRASHRIASRAVRALSAAIPDPEEQPGCDVVVSRDFQGHCGEVVSGTQERGELGLLFHGLGEADAWWRGANAGTSGNVDAGERGAMLEFAPAFSSCQDSDDGVSWNVVVAKREKDMNPGLRGIGS